MATTERFKNAGAPMAIRRTVGFDVFNVRLLIGLDKLLRKKRRYQGDLSASINDTGWLST